MATRAGYAGHGYAGHGYAGWCEDFEGYWEDAVYKDCGDKGFNSWSGAAGAYCCSGR